MSGVAPKDDEKARALADAWQTETVLGADTKRLVIGATQAQRNRALFNLIADGADGCIESLIKADPNCPGADPNCADEDGDTPLHIAAENDNAALLKLLIKLGATPRPNKEGRTPLHVCATDEDSVKVLLSHFPSIVDQKDNAGMAAIFLSEDNTFYLFAEAGADLTVRHPLGPSLLKFVAPSWSGPRGWAGPIILSGVKPEKDILLSTPWCSFQDLVSLVGAGADVNVAEEKNGNTPLHNALIYANNCGEHLAKLRFLLRKGASITARNKLGSTPLHCAVGSACPDAVKELYEAATAAKTDIYTFLNARDDAGNTALHIASAGSKFSIVLKLVDIGADVNAQDAAGNTPLHLSVHSLYHVELYLRKGAYTDIKNAQGETPLDLTAKFSPAYLYKDGTTEPLNEPARKIIELLKKTNNPAPVGKAAAKKK